MVVRQRRDLVPAVQNLRLEDTIGEVDAVHAQHHDVGGGLATTLAGSTSNSRPKTKHDVSLAGVENTIGHPDVVGVQAATENHRVIHPTLPRRVHHVGHQSEADTFNEPSDDELKLTAVEVEVEVLEAAEVHRVGDLALVHEAKTGPMLDEGDHLVVPDVEGMVREPLPVLSRSPLTPGVYRVPMVAHPRATTIVDLADRAPVPLHERQLGAACGTETLLSM